MIEDIVDRNGYDYVDLGLPGGTLWATMNVGASKPSDYGLFFSWGETKGYSKEQIGIDKEFAWDDYKWFNGDDLDITKYNENNATLELEDDTAHVYMGGSWHIPSPEQMEDLINCTTSEWVKKDDVYGRLFISKKDSTKSIFIPASGEIINGSMYDDDGISGLGFIWSSTLDKDFIYNGMNLEFDIYDISVGDVSDSRCDGMCIRGVIG